MNEKIAIELSKRAERITDIIRAKGVDISLVYKKSFKNNTDINTFCIKAENNTVAPSIHLNDELLSLNDNDLADAIIKIYQDKQISVDNESLSLLKDPDYIIKSVIPKLIESTQHNLNGVKTNHIAYVPWNELDLLTTFIIPAPDVFNEGNNGFATIQLTTEQLKSLDIDINELFKAAISNIENDYRLIQMHELLAEIMGGDADLLAPSDGCPDMWVLSTNNNMMFGASLLLSEKVTNEVCDRIGTSFYILPSSIHETILLPIKEHSFDHDENMLIDMIHEVNSGCVDPVDRLSDSLFIHDANGFHQVKAA